MSTLTPKLGLNLWDPADRFSFKAMNRDNEALETLFAPIAAESPIVSSAARINAYNNMKSMRYLDHLGHITTEKMAMFFGDFDSAAPYTSADALLMTEKYGYVFSPYDGSSYACGAAGDVSNTLGKTECSFNFEAPVSGYIVSLEADLKAASSGVNCYLSQCYFGDTYTHNVKVGAMSTVRGIQTLTFSTPIPIHKGDILTGALVSGTMEGTGYLYSAVLGEPYIKFNIVPAMESGWIKSELTDLGSMGHCEVRAYIQGIKETDSSITATLIGADGQETTMEPVGTRNTVTPAGVSCVELEFVASYSETEAQLRIDVDAADGYADIYNYAVIGI